MDNLNDNLICRLCNIQVEEDELICIFDKDINLAQKINDTLSLKVSPDDYSRYICLDCYKKVIKHYDFMQNILKLSKENISTTMNNSLCKFNRNEKIEMVSKLHDVIYKCPNCYIDLMIITSNNLENSNCAVQISVAAIDQVEKSIQKDIQTPKNTIDLDNTCMQMSSITDDEMKPCIVINESISEEYRSSLVLQEDNNYIDTYITYPNRNMLHQTRKDAREEFQENINETDNNLSNLEELETEVNTTTSKPDDNLLNSDYNSTDNLIKIESVNDSVNNLINIETVNDDTNSLVEIVSNETGLNLNEKVDSKEGDDTEHTPETERERVDKDSTKCKDTKKIQKKKRNTKKNRNTKKKRNTKKVLKNTEKTSKIICDLCGKGFFSQMRYEFHMKRHELNKMDKLVCTICEKETGNEKSLWNHYFYTHKNPMRYACAECNKTYAKKWRLKSHQKDRKHFGIKELYFEPDLDQNVRRKQKSINCSLCENPITDLDPKVINDLVMCAACDNFASLLMADDQDAVSLRPYHCSKCSRVFMCKKKLEFHEMQHNKNMSKCVCNICGKEFNMKKSLYEHYCFVHWRSIRDKSITPFKLRGKSFQLQMRLKDHIRMRMGEKPYQCDVCGQRCISTIALRIHRKTHFSHIRYTCNKLFVKKQNMNERLEKHRKENKNVSLSQVFSCRLCAENLPTYHMLKNHMIQIHKTDDQDPLLTEQQPLHECNECHEKFKHHMYLKKHKEKMHKGSPTFECKICKSTYKTKQLLINHTKVKHGSEKRYKCAKCHVGFNSIKYLYYHILMHTGRKPFQRNLSFQRKDIRDYHHLKHTGERPLQCSDCTQKFSNYKRHTKHCTKEHSENKPECPQCREKCSNQQEIKMHLNKHLGEKLNMM